MIFYVIGNDHNHSLVSELSNKLEARSILSYSADVADAIVVLGGDGTMLSAIREHAWLEKPFIGYNLGTLGFLMNPIETVAFIDDIVNKLSIAKTHSVYDSVDFHPLKIEVYEDGGMALDSWAFNDMWIERASGQTLAMDYILDDMEVAYNVRGDGVLVCTPQGSTAYNKALGGRVIPHGVNAFQITPIASMVNKKRLDSILANDESMFEVVLEDVSKRPARLMVDGIEIKTNNPISFIDVFVAKEIKITLMFESIADYDAKVSSMQFLS